MNVYSVLVMPGNVHVRVTTAKSSNPPGACSHEITQARTTLDKWWEDRWVAASEKALTNWGAQDRPSAQTAEWELKGAERSSSRNCPAAAAGDGETAEPQASVPTTEMKGRWQGCRLHRPPSKNTTKGRAGQLSGSSSASLHQGLDSTSSTTEAENTEAFHEGSFWSQAGWGEDAIRSAMWLWLLDYR